MCLESRSAVIRPTCIYLRVCVCVRVRSHMYPCMCAAVYKNLTFDLRSTMLTVFI